MEFLAISPLGIQLLEPGTYGISYDVLMHATEDKERCLFLLTPHHAIQLIPTVSTDSTYRRLIRSLKRRGFERLQYSDYVEHDSTAAHT
jgi:hypothetical protein